MNIKILIYFEIISVVRRKKTKNNGKRWRVCQAGCIDLYEPLNVITCKYAVIGTNNITYYYYIATTYFCSEYTAASTCIYIAINSTQKSRYAEFMCSSPLHRSTE